MKSLWKSLGGLDSLVEFNECALRVFLKQNQEFDDKEFNILLKQQASELGIHLGGIAFENYRQQVYLWYLIHPYGCFDMFTEQFISDLKIFGINVKKGNDGNSLQKLLDGLNNAHIIHSIESYKIELDNYYRHCRNHISHKFDQRKINDIITENHQLDKTKIFSFYPTLTDALKSNFTFTFDDYTLCTANIKNICDIITTDVYNYIDWTHYDIEKEDSNIINKLKRLQNNRQRQLLLIQNTVLNKYGIKIEFEKCESILNTIMAH